MVLLTQAPEISLFTDEGRQTALSVAKKVSSWIHTRSTREDFIQDTLLEMLAQSTATGRGLPEPEMWQIANTVRKRYWRTFAKNPVSLNVPVIKDDGKMEFGDLIPAKVADLNDRLAAKIQLEELPPGVKCIAKKLERGDPLTRGQEKYLANFRNGKTNTGRNRYQRLRAAGLCVHCGQEKASVGATKCPHCQERHRLYQAKHRRKKGTAWLHFLRQHWRKAGLCRCGHIPEPGYKLCPHCRQKNKEYLKRFKERRKEVIYG